MSLDEKLRPLNNGLFVVGRIVPQSVCKTWLHSGKQADFAYLPILSVQ